MNRWSGRVALVTGASVGIGAAICHKLTEHGINVIGCARNIDKLNELAQEIASKKVSGSFKGLKCDLQIESDIKSVFNYIRTQFGRIDICINNAGLANNAPLISGSTDAWKEMVNVNIIGLSICTREAIKLMLEKNINDGQIIQISSMSGHRVVPSSSTHFYAATKFAVRALTDGLRHELREIKSEIRVCEISPGMVLTEFAYRLNSDNPQVAKERYASLECIKAEDVADVVCDILQKPPYVEINDVLMRPTQQKF